MLEICDAFRRYHEDSRYIDWREDTILQTANALFVAKDTLGSVKRIYHFVRDEVKHSWDAQDPRVTVTASEVLRERVGICWAKSNLLAGLLRAVGFPAGICYQRLTLGDTPDTGYAVHALNAVYLAALGRWVRLDARGNGGAICAEFCLEEEKLAFPVRPEFGEVDYRKVYAAPLPFTMEILERSTDALVLYQQALPDAIPEML